jgi:hypothetical protein
MTFRIANRGLTEIARSATIGTRRAEKKGRTESPLVNDKLTVKIRSEGTSLMLQLLDDLAMLRELPRLMFGVDQPAVRLDVEDAAAAFDHFNGNIRKLRSDRVGQTGRSGFIVSLHAVFDGKIPWHGHTSVSDRTILVAATPPAGLS